MSADVVRPLRKEVLRPGHGDETLVFTGDEDPETLHASISLKNTVVGVATVLRDPHPNAPQSDDWRIRGMATSPELRNLGIGTALMAACEAHAREHGGMRLWCNARVKARAFYERGGLVVEGDVFEIPTVGPHYLMSKFLR